MKGTVKFLNPITVPFYYPMYFPENPVLFDNDAVFIHRFGAARQIAHIQGHERQHTGGEEAEQPLNKHGENWHAGFDVKTHSISFTCCGFIRR